MILDCLEVEKQRENETAKCADEIFELGNPKILSKSAFFSRPPA